MGEKMSNDKEMLKRALVGSTIMFLMTSIGHVLVYLCNKEDVENEE